MAGQREAELRVPGIGSQQIDKIRIGEIILRCFDNAVDQCLVRIDGDQHGKHQRAQQRDRPRRRQPRALNGRGSEFRSLQQHH